MTTPKATLPQVTDTTTPEVPPPADSSARTSEKTRARLSDLRPHPRNPRTISPARLEQLQRTLAAEPDLLEARPLIALPDGTVVAGNQRLAAAVALGWESIPVVYADLSPEEVTRWMLLDNRGFGEDDRDAVAVLLGELEAADSDLDLTGYEAADLDAMLRELHRPAADPDEVPPVPVVARSVVGEVYELGPHRLMCGDSTDAGHVEDLVTTERPAAMLTDPPYGIEREGIPNDDPKQLRALFDATLALAPIADAVIVAFQSPRLVVEWIDAVRSRGHTFERLLWLHRQTVISTYPWHGWLMTGDAIVVSSIGKARWPRGASNYSHDTYVKTGAEDASLNGAHSTIKPMRIVEDIAEKLPAGPIYEPFAGSGTTLIAAERQRRRCFAMEIDPAYCDVIRQRYADYVGDQSYAP